METIRPTPIAELRPYTKAEKIKIRVCRIWKSSIPTNDQKYVIFHCILVDETNNAVEASAPDIDYEVVASKIQAGDCYEIMNFRTINIRGQYKVVPHDTQLIFTDKTVFIKLSAVFPPIPRHRFFFQDFNMLYPRLNRDDILTDVIGHLTAVQHLEPKQINQRIVQKCDARIENIRKEEVSVTLWEDVAKAFSSLSVHTMSLPIIIVFTSLKVKVYLDKVFLSSTSSSLFFIDPDIPEVNSYKSTFSAFKSPVQLLAPSSKQMDKAEVLHTGRRLTIDELAFLDPDLYKNDTFLCNASVKRFDTRYNWWYSACPSCIKQMQKDPTTGQLICQKHPNQIPTPWYKVNLILEDSTNEISALVIGKSGEKLFGISCKDLVMKQRLIDQQQLPNEFLKLIGQKKIFHLRFGNRRNTFNPSDLLIFNISDDEAFQPITPQVLRTESTISSTTVSSSTSPTQTINQSHKRKREPMRRALFTGTGQSEAEEVSEIDPKELDEIPLKSLK